MMVLNQDEKRVLSYALTMLIELLQSPTSADRDANAAQADRDIETATQLLQRVKQQPQIANAVAQQPRSEWDRPFKSQEHFIQGMNYPLAAGAQRTPPMPCDFKLGDSVTFTNDNDVSFHNKTVTGFSSVVDGGRFVYLDKDSWWFPVDPARLSRTPN